MDMGRRGRLEHLGQKVRLGIGIMLGIALCIADTGLIEDPVGYVAGGCHGGRVDHGVASHHGLEHARILARQMSHQKATMRSTEEKQLALVDLRHVLQALFNSLDAIGDIVGSDVTQQ